MDAGRELDAAVAEKVFGWKRFCIIQGADYCFLVPPQVLDQVSSVVWHLGRPEQEVRDHCQYFGKYPSGWPAHDVPHYSTDWRAAGEVIEKFGPPGWVNLTYSKADRTWMCALGYCADLVHGQTGPHAICLAALAAVEKSEP